MSNADRQTGSRTVEPTNRRKRRDSPSRRARTARLLRIALEQATAERQESWSEGSDEFMSKRHADKLEGLHQTKRSMRRDVYRAAPDLEGTTVYRHGPKVGG